MSVQLNDRHITQLEELESLKGKLQCPSYRSRNLSSDRQYTPSLTNDFRSTRNSDQQKDSQSVEKFMNLKQQNQNVDYLSQLWKQQKQSISLTQSLQSQNAICTFVIFIKLAEKQEIDQQIPKYTHQVIEEEENLVTEQDANKIKVVQAVNNVRVNGKFPTTTKQGGQKKSQQQAQNLQTSNNQGQNKKTNSNINNNNIRPQTTKSQVQVPQTPQTQKRTVQKSNTKSFQDQTLDIPQTPSQKLKQSSLLEKTRQGKVNQAIGKVMTKKESEEDDKNLVFQLQRLKESVTKLYSGRFENKMAHSSQFIEQQLLSLTQKF
ncbi:unnamed protein product (macronuclear) [Paramecium tetraurelia]|uniref:Uncharacterized protein n=1 Tax=Paramecium tetraurelia TaxID=5888 RepID=A0EAX4_PARTE|nr:uncharacterized protein GSPATT00025175001 [Paramecium tetraurelia]CAK92441.1 unnamed protein product [Paramecium tetraurelia]|eukprot:XP_001459838.1 hypothetical protein (macronuclear) [Paramecium tetraurelia strain d4-2]